MRITRSKQFEEATEQAPERTLYVRSGVRELTKKCAAYRKPNMVKL